MTKRYDQAYFDRWYRDPRRRMWAGADVARKVRMVVGVAERVLDRPVRSVLDVGCGEGSWQPVLRTLRPQASYLGVDSSEYAVRRFGRRRGIVLGQFGELSAVRRVQDAVRSAQGGIGSFDLVVCCDVLHYLPTAVLRAGLRELHDLARGPAYLEAYTSADDIDGDTQGFQRRTPAFYRRAFREAGFTPIGMQMYVTQLGAGELVELERR